MPSLWTDDPNGHAWIAGRRAAGPAPSAANPPEPDPAPDPGPKLVLFAAACAVAAVVGAAIEFLR
jgi:hypothetical protein